MTIKFPGVSGAANYIVAYKSTEEKDWIYSTTGKKATYSIQGMESGTSYQFKVAAVKDGKIGAWSNVSYRYFKTVSKYKVKGGKGRVTVSWAKNKKAAQYQISYATNKKMKNAEKVTVKGGTRTKYVLKGLEAGKTYYIRVRAIRKIKGKNYSGILTKIKKVKVK